MADAGLALRGAFDPPRDFVSGSSEYRTIAFEPGNVGCWQGTRLTFARCCNSTGRRRGVGSWICWRGRPELSFASCCAGPSLRPSEVPRRHRVIAALTTTPFRLYKLELVLRSLAYQTHRLDAIYLVLPYTFLRDWSWYDHPWWYKELAPGQVRILRCEQDFKSQSAVLCILGHETDPSTRILVVDDDIVYHPMLAERLLAQSEAQPGAMVGAMSYYGAGVWCKEHDPHGACIQPNLVHTTYGMLFQRRFFDAGIFNYGAAAHALGQLRPDMEGRPQFTVTSCMIQDNLWYEAHLAVKGIPRVFLKTDMGAKQTEDLAFAHGSLFSGYQGHYHFHANDPHTIDEAQRECSRALTALWGPSLWAARPRSVAIGLLPWPPRVADVARLLARLPWWDYDSAVAFACSGRTLAEWRQRLVEHGGLGDRVFYLHRFGGSGFDSELFDHEAFEPSRLKLSSDATWLDGLRGFQPAAAVAGHERAGVARPVLDLVELCPANEEPVVAPRVPDGCLGIRARTAQDWCGRDGAEPQLKDVSPSAFAAVRCCLSWSFQGAHHDACLPNWVLRNRSWITALGSAGCLPQSATYREASRICQTIGFRVCGSSSELQRCCDHGCEVNRVSWVYSPAVEACISAEEAAGKAAQPEAPGEVPLEFVEPAPEVLRVRMELFLSQHEEARSTVVTCLGRCPGGPGGFGTAARRSAEQNRLS